MSPVPLISASGVQHGMIVNPDGSINISGTITTTSVTGSESFNFVISGAEWISEREFRDVVVSGEPFNLGSVVISGTAIFIGSVRQLTDPWIILGSTQITNPADIGSIATQTIIGSVRQLTDPWIILGSTQITNPGVIGSFTSQTIVGSVGVTTDPLPISGTINLKGYNAQEIIRKDSGSPAINYVFSTLSESVLIDNLGSSPIYFQFDATANPANSGTAFMDFFSFRVFDAIVGSISVQGSGLTSPEVQVIRLT